VRFTACSLTSAITTEAIIGSINRGKGFLAIVRSSERNQVRSFF
jgi:hypothetical protein